jgi:hypothetical protein
MELVFCLTFVPRPDVPLLVDLVEDATGATLYTWRIDDVLFLLVYLLRGIPSDVQLELVAARREKQFDSFRCEASIFFIYKYI